MIKKSTLAMLFVTFLFSCKKNEDPLPVSSQDRSMSIPIKLSSIHVCSAGKHQPKGGGLSTSGVGFTADFWPNNPNGPVVLRVKFLDNEVSSYVRSKIQYYAKVWEQYANVRFDFVRNDQPAEIRITTNGDGSSWSMLGKNVKTITDPAETMHYGWFDDNTDDTEFSRVVVHEFGHALGLMHEQSSPLISIQWNKPVVYAYYARDGWSQADVDDNVFYKMPAAESTYSAYDPASIMHYPIPKEFTLNGISVGWNTQLSTMDKSFIQKMYPFTTGGVTPTEVELYTITGFTGYIHNIPATNTLHVKANVSGAIILYEEYPGYPLDFPWKNDQYLITDASGNRYAFNSQSRFSAKTTTGLKGSIKILKNNQQVFSN